jgi:hypothetical protein
VREAKESKMPLCDDNSISQDLSETTVKYSIQIRSNVIHDKITSFLDKFHPKEIVTEF